MEEIKVTSWEHCQRELKRIEEHRNKLSRKEDTYVSSLLYRGHANHKWRLATTLERFSDDDLGVETYFRKLSVTKSQIESLTDSTWVIPDFGNFRSWLSSADMFMKGKLPGYEYMV